MQTATTKLWESFWALNKLSRTLLYIGIGLCYAALLICWALEIFAGYIGDYWMLHFLAHEISASARSGAGILGISAIVASVMPSNAEGVEN